MRLSSLKPIACLSLTLALTASLAACTTQVVSGIGGGNTGGSSSTGNDMTTGPGTGGTGGTGGAIDGGQAPSADAIAIRYGDIPAVGGSGSSVASSGTGTTIDPDSTELVFSDAAVSCGNDFYAQPCNSWRISFILAPAMLTPGTIDFASLNVFMWEQESESPPGSGQCGGGGGGGGPASGTLEILSVDAGSVTVRITGLDESGLPINGDHTVLRCPAK